MTILCLAACFVVRVLYEIVRILVGSSLLIGS